jgi:hypothetical protein
VEILVQDKDRELLFLKPDFTMDDGIIIKNVLLWMERLDAAQKYAYDGEETSLSLPSPSSSSSSLPLL